MSMQDKENGMIRQIYLLKLSGRTVAIRLEEDGWLVIPLWPCPASRHGSFVSAKLEALMLASSSEVHAESS